MSTPNPLIPQGMLPDNRGKSHVRIAVFTILAIHVVLLGALLIQGCKRSPEAPPSDLTALNTNYPPPPIDTNPPPPVAPPSNATAQLPSGMAPSGLAPSGMTPSGLAPSGVTPSSVTPQPTTTGAEHVVAKGDSFYTLSKKYGVSIKAIAEANPNMDSRRLKIGDKLVIPAASSSAAPSSGNGATAIANGSEKTYSVKSGDTLMKIAKDHGVSLKALRSANSLKTDQIKVGQKLKIPSKSAAPTAAASATSIPASAPASAPMELAPAPAAAATPTTP